MIAITNLHGKQLYINAELIEFVEANPDTQIILTTGRHVYASETPDEVANKVIEYKRRCRESTDLSRNGAD